MKTNITVSAIAFAVLLISVGCAGQPTPPTPTLAVTAPPANPTVPTAPASSPPTASAKSSPSAAASGPAPSDLAAKARGIDQYSVNLNATGAQPFSGKMYVKGTKLREEASIAGQNSVMLVDSATRIAYLMLVGQNSAVKMDFSQAVAQATPPSQQVAELPANAKFVGTDTLDGKPAAIYEATTPQGTTRYWIWTDRGLPLRIESTTSQGKLTMDFTNYDFSPQPDSLFELPPGTQVVESPLNLPGLLTPQPKP